MKTIVDTIIVGSGLSGLTAALTINELNRSVILLEKEDKLGGNSIKASSGINACYTNIQKQKGIDDSLFLFEKDTIRSSVTGSKELIHTLINNSNEAIQWLEKYGIIIDEVVSLGGHSSSRTHRSSTSGSIGYSIVSKLIKAVNSSPIIVIKNATVNQLIVNNRKIYGVIYNKSQRLYANNVILTTGGFASNRKLIHYYHRDLSNLPTTNGPWSTGDGIFLGSDINAQLVDMNKIQVHPTGFIDPMDPLNQTKYLAAEMLRGVGGILLNIKGERFCNELGYRSHIFQKMKEQGSTNFALLIPKKAYPQAKKYIDFYLSKKLLKKINNITHLAKHFNINPNTMINIIRNYNISSQHKKDPFGKTNFPNTPFDINGQYYLGIVTPVLHYCMGGLKIDKHARVINKQNRPIPGLFAAGEVTGGLHGNNRLGGNSLLECVVFGRIAGLAALSSVNYMNT